MSQTNGASFIQERRTDSLGRYVMLRASYRLGSLGAGAGRGTPKGRTR